MAEEHDREQVRAYTAVALLRVRPGRRDHGDFAPGVEHLLGGFDVKPLLVRTVKVRLLRGAAGDVVVAGVALRLLLIAVLDRRLGLEELARILLGKTELPGHEDLKRLLHEGLDARSRRLHQHRRFVLGLRSLHRAGLEQGGEGQASDQSDFFGHESGSLKNVG